MGVIVNPYIRAACGLTGNVSDVILLNSDIGSTGMSIFTKQPDFSRRVK